MMVVIWSLKNWYFLVPQVEVFDILFVLEQDKKFIVHCQDCARKIHPRLEGFVVLKQYQTAQLCEIFDRFQLAHHVSPHWSSKGQGTENQPLIFIYIDWYFYDKYLVIFKNFFIFSDI